MAQDSAAALSLLSLSIAASTAQPITLPEGRLQHNRRLSSSGRRRRLSDALDAATRPSSSSILSTSESPPPAAVPASAPTKSSTPIPIASAGRKKRGVDHKCETCSKIYRHPSCLIKHRWEHTPHWRTLASLPAFPTSPTESPSSHSHKNAKHAPMAPLSKHAQVQLLEAAAILSHFSPDSQTGTSLPEDRGMWPRWVSGGTLEGEPGYDVAASGESEYVGSEYGRSGGSYGLRSGSGGPRLHDYEVPRGAEVRAGVVEVPHSHRYGSAWSVPRSVSVSASSEQSRSRSTPSDDEDDEDDERPIGISRGRRAGVWKREDEEFDLHGVREEGEEEEEKYGKKDESLRWGVVEQMEDIDMDMD
ncbi:hypothetical protein FB45DRAFT_928019 [Roridomyces roridus]|uniref:C2H2-type domain-containing protein n=1 Tax=Roridomyces roridus TaxID=1738132 RepID=A0AAD7BH56_9AGAR|nr:hypothetical protein FB45DRAFT_928019 [Roridomyces roridus]